MVKFLNDILRWSEVWALFLPLTFFLFQKKPSDSLFPLQFYLFAALALNIVITLISNIFFFYKMLGSNHIYYNLHSIIKVIFFGWFIKRNLPISSANIIKLIFIFYAGFVLVNFSFSFFQSIFKFSTLLLTIESIILLFLSIAWYLYMLQLDEKIVWQKQTVFLALTGISIYEAVSFFIFLFYNYLTKLKGNVAADIWKIHDIAFLVLCLFLAAAFQKLRMTTLRGM